MTQVLLSDWTAAQGRPEMAHGGEDNCPLLDSEIMSQLCFPAQPTVQKKEREKASKHMWTPGWCDLMPAPLEESGKHFLAPLRLLAPFSQRTGPWTPAYPEASANVVKGSLISCQGGSAAGHNPASRVSRLPLESDCRPEAGMSPVAFLAARSPELVAAIALWPGP